uniref:NADH-ubiquinone oxidoreductase chain 4 n=1 Tax=Idris sp. MM-2013 TaxID=1429433 RepID=A0A067YFR3_9HYME|nr:NADH dehydrogenase subunit 4 [Idris sp. MM-2013]
MLSMVFFFFGMLIMLKFLNKNLLMLWSQNMLFFFMFFYMIFLLNMKFYNYWVFINKNYGVDKISMMLIMLTFWMISLMVLSILSSLSYYYKVFFFQKYLLMFSLIMFFSSLNLINFYVYFEMSLIPILLMILGWGVQPERLNAGVYMMMYTLFSSLPFFILVVLMNLNFLTMNIFLLMKLDLVLMNSFIVYMFLIFIFLIKLPIYLLHLWLPKAHVEAPVFGSMVLAGIMLKLGGYGMIRFIMMFSDLMELNKMLLIFYILMGSLVVSILCLRQIDLKMLIAYSSIVHMGLMVGGLLTNYELSLKSNLSMMIGHGLCSSGLFCLLNLNYKRIGSRMLMMNKSMNYFFINMSLWWFLFCIMNMAAPPSLNLVSEIMLILLIIDLNLIMGIFIFFISLFSGIYSIYMYSYTQHGQNYFFKHMFNFNTIDEFLLMILHWIPMNFFIFNLILI